MSDTLATLLGLLLLAFLAYLALAIPYAYIKPWYLKLTKGKQLAEKIKKQNIALKKFFLKQNKKHTEATLKATIISYFNTTRNFKGLAGITFTFKNLPDFNYTFHIKKNKDILITCMSLGDCYGYTIDFFIKGKNFEVRQVDVENTVKHLMDQSNIHMHWGVSGKISFTAKSYAKNLLKDKNYELFVDDN